MQAGFVDQRPARAHGCIELRDEGLLVVDLLPRDRVLGEQAAEAFEEIWNLAKPVSGSGGWILAGIQQAQ